MDDTSQQVYQVRVTATVIFHLLKTTADLGLLIDAIYGFLCRDQKWKGCLFCPLMLFKEQQEATLYFHFSFLYFNKHHQ